MQQGRVPLAEGFPVALQGKKIGGCMFFTLKEWLAMGFECPILITFEEIRNWCVLVDVVNKKVSFREVGEWKAVSADEV